MTIFKVGVSELPPDLAAPSGEWSKVSACVAREAPYLFLLNEMPFGGWISSLDTFDERVWTESCSAHANGVMRLADLGTPFVAGSRPTESNNLRTNEAFIWSSDRVLQSVHTKQYFPEEEGYYEARWFQPGERHFRVAAAGALRCGFLICTELMFNEHARQYGRAGAHVILVPRAVGSMALDRWLVAMQMAAIVSGCYVLSSNRSGVDARGQMFGGLGWIIDPFGEVIAQTSAAHPVVFQEMDTDVVAKAQREYPCYVKE